MFKKVVGLVVAVETQAIQEVFGPSVQVCQSGPFPLYEMDLDGIRLVFVHSKAGLIRSAAASQFLMDTYPLAYLINFGVVGGLCPTMTRTNLCLVNRLVHSQFDTSGVDDWARPGLYEDQEDIYLRPDMDLLTRALNVDPSLDQVTCVSSDKFINDPNEKKDLHMTFDAEICDMEAAAIQLVASYNKIRCLFIKCVADSLFGQGQEYHEAFHQASVKALTLVKTFIQRNQDLVVEAI